MTLTFLKFYLAINVLLIFAYLLFRAFRFITESTRLPISYLSLNRIAQLLVVTAIATPILFALIPQESVPDLKFKFQV